MNRKPGQHPVMPSKQHISSIAAQALTRAIESKGQEASSTELSLLPTNTVAEAMLAVQQQPVVKPRKVDINQLESLERTPHPRFS